MSLLLRYVHAVLLITCSLKPVLVTGRAPWASETTGAKRSAKAFDFLSYFVLPVPEYAYNVSQASINRQDLEQLGYFSWNVDWWLRYFHAYNVSDIDINDTSNYICPTDWAAVYGDNVCPDASYISYPWYVVDDLRLSLPSDACNYTNDPHCFAWMNMVLEPINDTGLLGELANQKSVSEQNNTNSYYRLISDYIGVGFHVDAECKSQIVQTLESVDKFNEVGWQAATTLTALIPALLTIGNLFVPRSSEIFATSFLVGLMSAMFSLGLPVKSISGIDSSRRADVGTFSFKARHWLMRFGKMRDKHLDGEKYSANEVFDIATLQKWSADFDSMKRENDAEELSSTDWTFSSIKQQIGDWRKRAHFWQLPALLIASAQFVLFLLAIGPLFLSYGTPLLLFDCANYLTSLWLLIAAAISAVFRFVMWEKGVHERVSAFALSDMAISHFRDFVSLHPQYQSTVGGFEHTETDLPPLYPPLLNTLTTTTRSLRSRVFKLKPASGFPFTASSRRVSSVQSHLFFDQLFHRSQILLDNVVNIFKHPRAFVRAGVRVSEPPAAARRWRPMIILMHLSTDGRNPLVTLFTGLIEGFILILLTAFFAAQWGGNLFVMCYTTAVLLVAITLGRGLGLFYVCRSAHTHGLYVIETQDQEQIRGCLRILCSMEKVLIHVNSAWYFEGYRLDKRLGWQELQRSYNQGDFDGPDDSHNSSRQAPFPDNFDQYPSGRGSYLPLTTETNPIKRKPLPSPPAIHTEDMASSHRRLSALSSRRSSTVAESRRHSSSSIHLLSADPYAPPADSQPQSPISNSSSRRPSLLPQSTESAIPLHVIHTGPSHV